MDKSYDRCAEDIGNIVGLEHVNVQVADQRLATLFYITGLGLTRDPYLVTGVSNMWVNVGRSQLHLPTADPQVLRGRIGLVMPDLDSLVRRLDAVAKPLQGTRFGYAPPNGNDAVDVTCPWGNRFRCHRAGGPFAPIALGMAYVEFDVPIGAADGIARFYRDIFAAPARVENRNGAPSARVMAGFRQELVFRETDAAPAAYDGHHVQVYLANFSGPYERLNGRALITQDSSRYQYRFKDIVDPESGRLLFTIEHEVRSMTHPLYGRPLVNRNPELTNAKFAPGYEEQSWAGPASTSGEPGL